jgi:pimeloyl-ACP methyl ester carboxylesterase
VKKIWVEWLGVVTIGCMVTATGCSGPGDEQTPPEAGVTEVPVGHVQFAVSADGENIAYRVRGDGDATVVLIHGGFCDASYWDGLVPALVKKHRVVTLDLAGHGLSSGGRADWSMESFAEDVAAVVDQEDAANLVLIGHSLGGNTAPLAARRLGERVRAVIGVDTIAAVQYGPTPEIVEAAMGPFRADYAAAMDGYVRTGLFVPDEDPAIIDRVAAQMAGADPAMAVPALEALFSVDMAPALEWMHANGVALILLNNATQATDVNALRTHHPDMVFATFEGSGHFPMLTVPEYFNPLLMEHLDRVVAELSG